MNTFTHDSNARNDERILAVRIRHGAAGYGVYFMLLERLRDSSGFMCIKDYNVAAYDLRVQASVVKSVVEDFGLFAFTEDGRHFYSVSFSERMKRSEEISRKRSNAARKRHEKTDEDTEEQSVQEEQPKKEEPVVPTPMPGTEVHPYVEPEQTKVHLACMVNRTATQEAACMKFHLTPEQLKNKVEEFLQDCTARGVDHRNRRDALSHFNDWLRVTTNAKIEEEKNTRRRQPSTQQRLEEFKFEKTENSGAVGRQIYLDEVRRAKEGDAAMREKYPNWESIKIEPYMPK